MLDEARNALYYLDDLAHGPVAEVLDDLSLALESVGVSLPADARSFLYKPTPQLLSHLGVSKISDLPDY